MPEKKSRAIAGDVLEFRVGDGVAYLQCIGRHPEYGEAVLVCPRLHDRSRVPSEGLFAGGYVTFYPANAAVAHGLVQIVGHLVAPGLPLRFRRPGAMLGRSIHSWIIEDEFGETVRKELSDADLQLPIASIWNHEFLIKRVTEGWHPAQEGRTT